MSIIIGGVEPFTTVDFPGRLAAVLFCRGCTWRCPYCHNPELQPFTGGSAVPWETVLEFLDSRRRLLDGIVFSGGEPLWQEELPDAMQQVKDKGFEVGLHTSGASCERFERVLPRVDWIGFDVKAPFDSYDVRIPGADGREVLKSLEKAIAAGVPLEIRTTLDPRLISRAELREMARRLAGMGITTYALQEYRPHPSHADAPAASEISSFFNDAPLMQELNDLFADFIIRRA
ncbi:MAG: anaerobic ribonucleoside-triphosphate reductase activating protein [Alphaproteobacteria bacterium]|jgi:pyruvate formate lyase activating enzyme